MVTLNKAIEIIAFFDTKGMPRPYRFRVENDEGELIVYQVDSVLFRKKEVVNEIANIIVRCRGNMDGVMKEYELKYDVKNTRWSLYCM